MKGILWILYLIFNLAPSTQAYFGLTGKSQLSDLWSINFDAASLATSNDLDTWNQEIDDLAPSREYEAVDMRLDPPKPTSAQRVGVPMRSDQDEPASKSGTYEILKNFPSPPSFSNIPTHSSNLHQDDLFHEELLPKHISGQQTKNVHLSSKSKQLKQRKQFHNRKTMQSNLPGHSNHNSHTTRQPPRVVTRAWEVRKTSSRNRNEKALHIGNHRSYATRDTKAATRLAHSRKHSRHLGLSPGENERIQKETKLSQDVALIVNHSFSMPRVRNERESGKRRDLYGLRHFPNKYLVASSVRDSTATSQVGYNGRRRPNEMSVARKFKGFPESFRNQSKPAIHVPSGSMGSGVLEFDETEFNAYSAFIESKMGNFTDRVTPRKIDKKSAKKLCKTFRLNSDQRRKCNRDTGLPLVLAKATHIAAAECLYQFRYERWNCSLGTSRIHLLNKGYKETAFLYSISSAGLTHSVARACAEGHLEKCSCEENFEDHKNQEAWFWGGCGDNVAFAAKFVRRFLQSQSTSSDVRAEIDKHNSDLGIRFVRSNLRQTCKCHGVSGSCTTKTCWRKMAPFYEIGKKIKRAYDKAVKVENISNSSGKPKLVRKTQKDVRRDVRVKSPRAANDSRRNNRDKKNRRKVHLENNVTPQLSRNKHNIRATSHAPVEIQYRKENNAPKKKELVYIDNSPAYCKKTKFSLGTKGRICGKETDCERICCGRGFTTHVRIVRRSCECQVKWCCYVQCKTCNEKKQIHTCK